MVIVRPLASPRLLSKGLVPFRQHAITVIARRPLIKPITSRRAASSSLRINGDRMMRDLHETAQWGAGVRYGDHPTETGLSRPSLTPSDASVRSWFADTTRSLGCTLTVDEMGNQFAIRPGRRPGAPTVAGSHLDSQPTGGRYDGVLGVVAGVEMLRVLEDGRKKGEGGGETEFPVGVVNWTNEEGARFPISMVSSGVWAGSIPLSKAHSLASVTRTDPPNTTMLSELQRIGYHGSTPCSHEAMPLAAHFELHIEQGPILEANDQKIGVVEGVQAYRWFTVTVQGRDCHTGTTDFANRADALLAASRMIVRSREAAWKEGGLASTGIIEARPGSTNTVAGTVKFSLDVRAKRDETVQKIENELRKEFDGIAMGSLESERSDEEVPLDKVDVEWCMDSDSAAVDFHPDCIESVEDATRSLFGSEAAKLTRRMVSGAGHDSVYTSKRVPTSMIFVPCRDGVSHNPREYTAPEDCRIGAEILMRSVLAYDSKRVGE